MLKEELTLFVITGYITSVFQYNYLN